MGLHQGSGLSLLLFAVLMNRFKHEVRQESKETMMFTDDAVICSKSRKLQDKKCV